jgi:CheY-like chemotaxis protein
MVGDAMVRVLIVEDEKPIRELLDDFLSDEGFETRLAEDGRHGVDLARTEKPDLILMDLMLPFLDGIAAVRALKDAPETREIPVVVMSANSVMLLHIGKQRLADETIRKPFDLDDVLRVVRSRTGTRSPGAYALTIPSR